MNVTARRYARPVVGGIRKGDLIIQRAPGSADFELHDAKTGKLLLVSPTLRAALDLAIARGGALWRYNQDNRGRPLGDPVLLMPRSHVEASVRAASPHPRRSRRMSQIAKVQKPH